MTFVIKTAALEIMKEKGHLMEPGEEALTREVTYGLTDSGTVSQRQTRIRLTDDVRFAINQICKATGKPQAVSFSGEGWQSFLTTLELRHRISHPRHPDELQINADDWHSVEKAFAWWVMLIGKVADSLG
jgi:hypothetical protein